METKRAATKKQLHKRMASDGLARDCGAGRVLGRAPGWLGVGREVGEFEVGVNRRRGSRKLTKSPRPADEEMTVARGVRLSRKGPSLH